jgi:hypothetical protein
VIAERVVVVVALAALVFAVVLLARHWSRQRTSEVRAAAPNWTALGAEPDARRTLIAFSTSSCTACHQAQTPAIETAFRELVDIRLIRVDAARTPHAARAFGILTVPSTVVVAAGGKHVVAVNHGFTPSERLVEQLRLAA